jgi:hypothetical protein
VRPNGFPIGRPIANAKAYVLSPSLALQPVGVPGELFVGGAGVADGYLGRETLTRERFVRDPFAAAPNARMYRTGDRVRWTPDGVLEYLGRLDDQVKVRGVRVELGELESALRNVPGVGDATVVLHGGGGAEQLVAYYVADGEALLDAGRIRDALAAVLPPSVVPAAYVRVDAIPLTANGKVDRRALPAPPAPVAGDASVAPRDAIEEVVARVWCAVLEREAVGVEDSFFALGGHSLLATRVITRLAQVLRVQVPMRRFFAEPTVAGVARVAADVGGRERTLAAADTVLRVMRMSPDERERLRRERAERKTSHER